MTKQGYKDGEYTYEELETAIHCDFSSEKELCDYIESHMADFISDCLGFELKKYKRECPIAGHGRRVKGNRRIDFYIETVCCKRIGVECKHPFYQAELSSAIGQCLTYITLFERMEKPIDSIVILSTKIDWVLPSVISRFNLPIGFIAFDKSKFVKLLGDRR